MPSSTHEVLVELFRRQPALAATLLSGALGVRVPSFEAAAVESAEVVDLAPTQYRADAVVTLTAAGAPVGVVVIEVQTRPDPDKQWSWPVYLTTLRARHRCPAVLLVVCLDARTAGWAATPIVTGHPGLTLVPVVLGPDQVPQERDVLVGQPELAVLAALAHGRARLDVLDDLAAALSTVESDTALLYLRLVLAALPEAARSHLEALMTAETFPYQSEFTERLRAEGRDEGRAEGRDEGRVEAKVEVVLRLLRVRGFVVPDDVRGRIVACTDPARLDAWLDRAVTARSLDEIDL